MRRRRGGVLAVAMGAAALLSGSVVDAGFDAGDIVVIAEGSPAFQPSIAFNPERNEYLAVYKVNPTILKAVRLDANGVALGAAVEVAPKAVDSFKSPDVAYNAQTNQYLVVWNEFNPDGAVGTTRGQGRLLSDLGALVAPAQPIHLPMAFTGCRVQGVDIEANPITGGYSVVYVQWSTTTTGCDGDVREVQDEQTMIQPLGGLLQIGSKSEIRSGQAVTNYSAYLAVDPSSGQHVAGVYDRTSNRHISYLYTSNLTAGPVVPFAIPAEPGNDQYLQSDIAFDSRVAALDGGLVEIRQRRLSSNVRHDRAGDGRSHQNLRQ